MMSFQITFARLRCHYHNKVHSMRCVRHSKTHVFPAQCEFLEQRRWFCLSQQIWDLITSVPKTTGWPCPAGMIDICPHLLGASTGTVCIEPWKWSATSVAPSVHLWHGQTCCDSVASLAAAFWTWCRGTVVDASRHARAELQQSSLFVIKA